LGTPVLAAICPSERPWALRSWAYSMASGAAATGRHIDDEILAHIWPTHHENVHFYGTHAVDVDSELAKLDADGYRPLRTVDTAS